MSLKCPLQISAPALWFLAWFCGVSVLALDGNPAAETRIENSVLLKKLASSDFSEREMAARELAKRGNTARGEIQNALNKESDPLVRKELEYLLKPVPAGEAVWSATLPGGQIDLPWLALKHHRGKIFYASSGFNDRVFSLDVSNGAKVWCFQVKSMFDIKTFSSTGATSKHVLVQNSLFQRTMVAVKTNQQLEKTDHHPHLYAVDLETGKAAWDKSLADQAMTMAFGDAVAYVDADQKTIACIEIDSGRELWKKELPGPVRFERDRCDGGNLVVHSANDTLVVDGRSGEIRFALGSPTLWFVLNGSIGCCVLGPDTVVGISIPDKKEMWKYEVPGFKQAMSGLVHPPLVLGNRLVFTTGEVHLGNGQRQGANTLRCLDTATGKEQWVKEKAAYTLFGVNDDRALALRIEQGANRVNIIKNTGISLATGESLPLWPRRQGDTFSWNQHVTMGDFVYGSNIPREDMPAPVVGAKLDPNAAYYGVKSNFECLSAMDGSPVWSKSFMGAATLGLHLGGFMLVASEAGDIRLLRIAGPDGKP